jgi:transcriptional antiterminator RfaH
MLSDLNSASRVWAVIAVKPRKEEPAAFFLRKEGFEVYAPKLRRRSSSANLESLFPGYLFVWLSPLIDLAKVRYAPCVRRPLLFGAQLACVEEDLVGWWQAREGGRGFLTPEPPPPFAAGQVVQFKEGIFSGLKGIVLESLPAKDRVRVLLEYLSGSLVVEAERAILG